MFASCWLHYTLHCCSCLLQLLVQQHHSVYSRTQHSFALHTAGASRIVSLCRDCCRSFVSLDPPRRGDAKFTLRAVLKLKDLPIPDDQKHLLNSIVTGYAGRNLKYKPLSGAAAAAAVAAGAGSSGRGGATRLKLAPHRSKHQQQHQQQQQQQHHAGDSESEGYDSDDSHEWGPPGELTAHSVVLEAYKRKYDAVSHQLLLLLLLLLL
jgi:hypothetical protein